MKSIPLESEVQSQVIQLLKLHRYTVLTATVKLRGRMAGRHQTGQSKGIPDLLVTKDTWPLGVWVGVEVKRPGGKFTSEEQAELARKSRIIVTDDCEDAIRQLKPIDQILKSAVQGELSHDRHGEGHEPLDKTRYRLRPGHMATDTTATSETRMG